jgi:hypothetical protein
LAYATGSTGLAITVRGSSRRIMIMRFRPANIRLINRRQNLPRLLLALCSEKGKGNYENNPADPVELTRSLHIRPYHSSSPNPDPKQTNARIPFMHPALFWPPRGSIACRREPARVRSSRSNPASIQDAAGAWSDRRILVPCAYGIHDPMVSGVGAKLLNDFALGWLPSPAPKPK